MYSIVLVLTEENEVNVMNLHQDEERRQSRQFFAKGRDPSSTCDGTESSCTIFMQKQMCYELDNQDVDGDMIQSTYA